VLLQWLGHACFVLKLLATGFTVVIDPFPAERVGYKPIDVKADLALSLTVTLTTTTFKR